MNVPIGERSDSESDSESPDQRQRQIHDNSNPHQRPPIAAATEPDSTVQTSDADVLVDFAAGYLQRHKGKRVPITDEWPGAARAILRRHSLSCAKDLARWAIDNPDWHSKALPTLAKHCKTAEHYRGKQCFCEVQPDYSDTRTVWL